MTTEILISREFRKPHYCSKTTLFEQVFENMANKYIFRKQYIAMIYKISETTLTYNASTPQTIIANHVKTKISPHVFFFVFLFFVNRK